ncbi:MAG: CvpA family protein [Lachnospiraceae bacterium]|nr:CvpA family protein [Lachnospiraceae bacterium]
MNVTLLIVLAVLLFWMYRGWKSGMAKTVTGIISWSVTLFLISIFIMLKASIQESETQNVTISLILIAVTAGIYGIVRFFLRTIKIIAKLPIFHFLDRLVGIPLGLLEGIVFVWLLYVLHSAGLFGGYTERILTDTTSNQFLSILYEYNYLLHFLIGS